MREHIVAEHDEGREYLKCPTCDACVRCIRSHYKVSHPNRLIPTNMQMRVTVWHDFTRDGKKRTKKPAARQGFFISNKMNGKEVHYRSGYECEVYELLEADDEVLAYESEPFHLPYCHEGKWHKYIPDLKIYFTDGSTEIWEIKPATQTHYKVNQSKWAAMNEHAKNMGWQFTVITEVGMNKLKKKVQQQQQRGGA